MLCVSPQQNAANRVARRCCQQQNAHRHGEVISRTVQQLPFCRSAQHSRKPCKGGGHDQIQRTYPCKCVLPPKGGSAYAKPGQQAHRQHSQPRLHGRCCCIAAAQPRSEQEPQPFDPNTAQVCRRKQGDVIHQRVCAEQHIQINNHAAPPPCPILSQPAHIIWRKSAAACFRPKVHLCPVICPKPPCQTARRLQTKSSM